MKKILAIPILAFSLPAFSADIVEESRKAIDSEVAEYKEKGVAGFVAAVTKASPMMGDKSAEGQITGNLTSLEAVCGKAVGYSIKNISKLSDDLANALFIVNLEKCPLFLRQVFYRTKSEQIISPNFAFHPQPEQVWPTEVIFQLK